MGENALATTVELGKELARRRAKNNTDLDTENVIFFDVLGLFMVPPPLLPCAVSISMALWHALRILDNQKPKYLPNKERVR